METIKTICPRCFKMFSIPEEVAEVECSFCKYIFDMPKFDQRSDSKEGRVDYYHYK